MVRSLADRTFQLRSYKLVASTFGAEAHAEFEVDAYVLPKFAVNVTVAATYLLKSTKSVSVNVEAKYTFGEAVIG